MTTVLTLIALLAGPPAATSSAYAPEARVAYLDEALDAVKQSDAKTLAKAKATVVTLSNSTCGSQFRRLRADCLVTASQRACEGKAKSCARVMDLAVSNFLGEEELIPRDRRLEIMRGADFRKRLDAEVESAQGTIAADFALRTSRDAAKQSLSTRIDRYCLSRADASELSWQSCAGALVWFIGSNPQSTSKEP